VLFGIALRSPERVVARGNLRPHRVDDAKILHSPCGLYARQQLRQELLISFAVDEDDRCSPGIGFARTLMAEGSQLEAANALVRYAVGALGMRRIGLTTQRIMRLADALLKSSFSLSKVSRGARMYFQAAGLPTGIATRDLTWLVCPTSKYSGEENPNTNGRSH
jgi:hypothetical protein